MIIPQGPAGQGLYSKELYQSMLERNPKLESSIQSCEYTIYFQIHT